MVSELTMSCLKNQSFSAPNGALKLTRWSVLNAGQAHFIEDKEIIEHKKHTVYRVLQELLITRLQIPSRIPFFMLCMKHGFAIKNLKSIKNLLLHYNIVF